jgi:hypothetical protein
VLESNVVFRTNHFCVLPAFAQLDSRDEGQAGLLFGFDVLSNFAMFEQFYH